MKACKDCKHFKDADFVLLTWCSHENNVIKVEHKDYVKGEIKHLTQLRHHNIDNVRKKNDMCGEDAKWFEPKPVKPSLWQRIIGVAK